MVITQRQFHFSWATGTALLTAGAALASTGLADWGLFWVGGLITGLALSARLQAAMQSQPATISRRSTLLPPEA